MTLLATIANQSTFSTDDAWYTQLDDYDLIVLNCNAFMNSTYGALSGCFIPSMLKDALRHTASTRILMSNKYASNTELAVMIASNNTFNLFGASNLYIYGIKVGSEKQ